MAQAQVGRADVSMDFDVVEALADGFGVAAETLGAVDRALEVVVAVLRTSAFVGLVGNLGLAIYLDNIRPEVRRLAATCAELQGDLYGAIASLRDGDFSGSQRFVGGGSRAGAGRSLSSFPPRARMPGGVDGGLYDAQGNAYEISDATDTVFINGILTPFGKEYQETVGKIGALWGDPHALGLYNRTRNAVADIAQAFDDRRQALGLPRLVGPNPAVERLKELIVANANGDRELTLVAHSQGGAVLSAALYDLYRQDPSLVSFVKVTTFGTFGTDFPPGPDYQHFIHQGDPVPGFAQSLDLHGSAEDVARYYANLTVLPDPQGAVFNLLDDHDLGHYRDSFAQFRQEAAEVRAGGTSRQAQEYVEAQTWRAPIALGEFWLDRRFPVTGWMLDLAGI